MGPIGCSWPIPALCIVKNIYYSLAALGLGCARGAFTAHRAGPFLAVHGAVAPRRVGSPLPDQKSEWCLLPCEAELNHWTARRVSDPCFGAGEHRFESGGRSLVV